MIIIFHLNTYYPTFRKQMDLKGQKDVLAKKGPPKKTAWGT